MLTLYEQTAFNLNLIKMKKMKKIVYLLVMLMVISCSPDNNNLPNSNELNIDDIFKDIKPNSGMDYNYINISASNIHGKTAQVNVHKNMKSLLKKSSKTVLSINQNKIPFEKGNIEVYTKSKKNLTNITPIFGRNIIISLNSTSLAKGSETLNQEVEVYNPEMIKATNKEELLSVYKTNDLTIYWEPDPVNDKPISIVLISRQLNSTNDQVYDVHLTKLVNDVGKFTINSSELSIFPNNSMFDIILARGNTAIFKDTKVNLYSTDLISSEIKKRS
jgi:hypothetical protein